MNKTVGYGKSMQHKILKDIDKLPTSNDLLHFYKNKLQQCLTDGEENAKLVSE